MGRNVKWWSEEEDKELMEFMEKGLNEGFQVRYLAEEFSKKHPELSTEQVRAHYYQLKNLGSTEYEMRAWTPQEETYLMEYMEKNNKSKNKIALFDELSQLLNRNPRAIASHYYLIKKGRKGEAKDLNTLILNANNEDIKKAKNLLTALEQISKFDDKDKEIFTLQSKLSEAEKENEELQKRLERAMKTIENYERKFENMKKIQIEA